MSPSFDARRFGRRVAEGFLFAVVLLLGACETTVDPIRSSDRTFSLSGLINAGADTQFVRVERIRDSVAVGAPPTLDARVTLTNVESGESTVLRDSFATIRPGVRSHLFWAPVTPAPGATVEVRVTGSDGSSAVATVTLPGRAPELVATVDADMPCDLDEFGGGRQENRFEVYIQSPDPLAGVIASYRVYGSSSRFSHSEDVVEQTNRFRALIRHEEDLERVSGPRRCGGCPCRSDFNRKSVRVIAATAGPDGPPLSGITREAVARPDSLSNVRGGAGYVGGIFSDTLEVPLAWEGGGASASARPTPGFSSE